MKAKQKVNETKKIDRPCACETHLKMDKERNSVIPCVGHGVGCPCTANLEAEKQAAETPVVANPEKIL